MRLTRDKLIKIIKEELSRVVEGEIVDFPGGPKAPWVFGPDGYIKRPQLTQQYEKKQDIGADSPPEAMIARALAYRASELTNYQQEFDDEIFSEEIIETASAMQMLKPKELASQQDAGEVEEMGIDFERFLQGIESGKVTELEREEED